jgi:hypothetical protein
MIDGKEVAYTYTSVNDAWRLSIEYRHSFRNIKIWLGKEPEAETVKEKGCILKLKIKDPQDDPIAGASVSTTITPSEQQNLNGYTDNEGIVIFDDVKQGSYTFEVNKDGYNSKSESVTAESEEIIVIIITLEAQEPDNILRGIPGFSYETITLGLGIGIILLWKLQRRTLYRKN